MGMNIISFRSAIAMQNLSVSLRVMNAFINEITTEKEHDLHKSSQVFCCCLFVSTFILWVASKIDMSQPIKRQIEFSFLFLHSSNTEINLCKPVQSLN